jgi:hypothetical protein
MAYAPLKKAGLPPGVVVDKQWLFPDGSPQGCKIPQKHPERAVESLPVHEEFRVDASNLGGG